MSRCGNYRHIITTLVAITTICFSLCANAEDLADNWPDAVYLPFASESKASNMQSWKPAPAQWGKMLDFYTENNIYPGISVLIKSPKWGVRFVSSGRPILEIESIPFKPTTQFRIGSCSKAPLSIVILQMDYEHKLNLSDPITKHLPPEITSIIPNAEDITILNCLDMTSGLRSYTDIPVFNDPQQETALDRYEPETVLRMAMDYDSYVFLPGTTTNGEMINYDYTNTGYLLCGLIAQKIDKKPLQDVLRDRVFNKIGMTDTFMATDFRITRRMANGYTAFYETGMWQNCILYDQTVPWAAGAIISTPFDLLHFYETIFESENLINSVSRRKFLRMNYALLHKGYGKAVLEEVTPNTMPMLGHGGTILGFLTLMLYSPEEDFYFINYMNTWDNKYGRPEIFSRIAHFAFGSPESPTPSDGKTGKIRDGKVSLLWRPGNLKSEEYHVYVGITEPDVTQATMENHKGVSFDRVQGLELAKKGLQPGKHYYWRVDTYHKLTEREIELEHEDIETLMANFNTYKYREVPEYEIIQGPVWTFIAE
ncbi:MAG: beta-lactamase family protein [Candidatus Latescibacteria bacterium]|nr:beta-lactamase family protein [Candidatus Latescibacterota bacterium]